MLIYRGLKISLLSLVLCISCIFFCDAYSQPGYQFYQLILEGSLIVTSTAEVEFDNYDLYVAEDAMKKQIEEDLGRHSGYDPDDPVATGEVDPEAAYNAQQAEEMDRAMAEEAERAWLQQNEPQPDISDQIIKP